MWFSVSTSHATGSCQIFCKASSQILRLPFGAFLAQCDLLSYRPAICDVRLLTAVWLTTFTRVTLYFKFLLSHCYAQVSRWLVLILTVLQISSLSIRPLSANPTIRLIRAASCYFNTNTADSSCEPVYFSTPHKLEVTRPGGIIRASLSKFL